MTKREIKLLLKNRFQQLEIIRLYSAEFEEKEGKKAVLERIDKLLDEINQFKNLLNEE